VEVGPFKDEPERPRRELASHGTRLDLDGYVVLPIDRVEVGWAVIAVEHADDDAEEAGYLWHMTSRVIGLPNVESTPLPSIPETSKTDGPQQAAALTKLTTKYVAYDVHEATTAGSGLGATRLANTAITRSRRGFRGG
jgi:hypothetical protein